MSMFSSPGCREVSKYTVEKLRSDFNFAGSINAHAQSIMGSAFQFGHHAVEGIDTIITSLVLAFSDVFLSYPIAQNIPDGSSSDFGKENSRSFPAVDDGFELDSFTDVDIGETTESKATKSKIKTEVEENYPSTNCRLFLLIIQLRQCRKFAINELQIRL